MALGEQGTIVFSKVGERQACEGMNHKAGCTACAGGKCRDGRGCVMVEAEARVESGPDKFSRPGASQVTVLPLPSLHSSAWL